MDNITNRSSSKGTNNRLKLNDLLTFSSGARLIKKAFKNKR
jgi:hypothetical protein